MEKDWVERRIAEAQAAMRGTAHEVPDAVVATFRALLAEELLGRLKPEDLKGLVVRLAKANNPTAE
ncbi:hypothetical protein [Aminobacter aminovorans]|uniref:hypothetical protein n=1 Tax=Aminobacter aminovorans TaxID=83263 RepID=UPI00285DB88E|nr:hypothetical protein [Aminobacter aminovorans]MDR7225059.1 hypothetical protein [Aminobacter aminovorans]